MSPFKWNKFSQLGNNVSSSGVTWGGGSWKLDKAWAVTSLPPGTGREFNNQLITGHSVIAYQLTKANITPLTTNGLHFHLCRHASIGFYLLTFKRPSNRMLKTHNNKVMCCANALAQVFAIEVLANAEQCRPRWESWTRYLKYESWHYYTQISNKDYYFIKKYI